MAAPVSAPIASIAPTAHRGDDARPVALLGRLLDAGSLRPLRLVEGVGIVAARGRMSGVDVVAFWAGDADRTDVTARVLDAVTIATRHRRPLVGLWPGESVPGSARAADGTGKVLAAMAAASGVVPQIAVVLGPCAGFGPALADLVVTVGDGGPWSAHATVVDEGDALRWARRVVSLVGRPGTFGPVDQEAGPDPAQHLPLSPRRAYDVRPLVCALLDRDAGGLSLEELQPRWAPNVVTGLGRLTGRSVGVLANNPLRKGGCLDGVGAEKAARFVRMCDAIGLPLVVVVDVPGYLPGVAEEWGGVVRRGAKLLYAFAEAAVPRVTLITRKSYGGAYIAMNSKALGAHAVFAWPGAEVAVMGPEAAVGVLHRRELAAAADAERPEVMARLVAEHVRTAGGVERAVSLGVVDEVIQPRSSRSRLATALAAVPAGRGRHENIPL
jgi:acetyl-CoA/propionyl-CoA carboxylase carboxyl transferase subunit